MKNIPVRHIIKRTEPDFLGNFNIRDVSKLLAGKDMVQELHRHDYFFILLLKKGAGMHVIDFLSYKINNYSVHFMYPGQVHQLVLKAGSTGYLIQFDKQFYYPTDQASAQLLYKTSAMNLCQLDVKKIDKLLTIAQYIFKEYSDKQEGYNEVIKANLGIFFIELLRNRQNKTKHITNNASYAQERMDELLQLIESHITTHKRVAQYAEMLNQSVYQLNSICKSAVGKTCSDLINEYIILEAKRSLLATSNQINQIAYQLGYEDPSYFIRFFKKHTGYSPDAFRQQSK